MRSAIIAGAFAAGAIAVPFQKRDLVTDIDVVFVTAVVTVIAGQGPATEEAAPTSSLVFGQHWGHGHNWPASSEAATSTSEYVAPAAPTSISTSTYVAPAPTTTTSEYVAPVTTSSAEWVAPVTSSTSEWVAPAPSTTEEPVSTTPVVQWSAPASTSEVEEASAPASTPAPAASSTYDASTASYSDTVVYHHNLHRANHSSPDIQWDAGLAITAGLIAKSCIYAHNTDINSDDASGGGYGQNIAAGVDAAHVANVITDMFYNGEVAAFEPYYGKHDDEVEDYEVWGHFSQIVWKATTHVGCATQHCPNGLSGGPGKDFTVCNYRNTGNVFMNYGSNPGNGFIDNVGVSLGHATVTAGN